MAPLKPTRPLLDRTLRRATDLVNTAVGQAEQYGVSRALTLKLLEQAEGLFDDLAELGRETPQLRYRKAWMLIASSHNYAILGDTTKQLARITEARRLLAGLAIETPDERSYQSSLSLALSEHGKVLQARGNLDEALESYRTSLAVGERLVASDSNNPLWLRNLVQAQDGVAGVLLVQGKLDEALESYRASLSISERFAAAEGGEWQRDVAGSRDKIGNVLLAQGKLDEALESYRAALAIAERLAAASGSNIEAQHDLVISRGRVGVVLAAQGKLDEALESFRASLAVAERLAAIHPQQCPMAA